MSAAQAQGRITKAVPQILFVCVHNAGRSQMAAALAEHRSAHRVPSAQQGRRRPVRSTHAWAKCSRNGA